MPGKTIFITLVFLFSVCLFTSANAVGFTFESPEDERERVTTPTIDAPASAVSRIPSTIDNDDNHQYISNPISIYNGNKRETRTDVRLTTPNVNGLTFTRYYNSRLENNG